MTDSFSIQQWAATPPETYDLSERFEAEIAPLLDELQRRAEAMGLPYYFIAQETNNFEGGLRHTQGFLAGPARASIAVMLAQAGADGDLPQQIALHAANKLRHGTDGTRH